MMRISLTTTYRKIRSGELNAVRIGGQYRIPRRTVLAYMEMVDDICEEDR